MQSLRICITQSKLQERALSPDSPPTITCSIPFPNQGFKLTASNIGSQIMPLCLARSLLNSGRRSSACRWFSTVQYMVMLLYPFLQSVGKHRLALCIRFVTNTKLTSERNFIISHASCLQSSASSMKKVRREACP